jgi:hypothetical protein
MVPINNKTAISFSKIARASQQLTPKLQNPMAVASLTMPPRRPCCAAHYSATTQQPTSGHKLYEVTPSTRQDFDDGAAEREMRERTGRQYKINRFSDAKKNTQPRREASTLHPATSADDVVRRVLLPPPPPSRDRRRRPPPSRRTIIDVRDARYAPRRASRVVVSPSSSGGRRSASRRANTTTNTTTTTTTTGCCSRSSPSPSTTTTTTTAAAAAVVD